MNVYEYLPGVIDYDVFHFFNSSPGNFVSRVRPRFVRQTQNKFLVQIAGGNSVTSQIFRSCTGNTLCTCFRKLSYQKLIRRIEHGVDRRPG